MKRLVIFAIVSAVVAVPAALLAALPGDGASNQPPPPVAAFDGLQNASDQLPATAVATQLINTLGLRTDSSRRVAVRVSDGIKRAVFVVPTKDQTTCLIILSTTEVVSKGLYGETIYGCSESKADFFGDLSENIGLIIHEEGNPDSPKRVEIAGAVRSGADVRAVRVSLGQETREVPVTGDGGFLIAVDSAGNAVTGVSAVYGNGTVVPLPITSKS